MQIILCLDWSWMFLQSFYYRVNSLLRGVPSLGLHAPTRMEHVIVWELSVDHTHLNCHSLCIQSSALVRSHHHGINARSYSCKYTDMLNPRWCLLITLCLRCVMMSLSPINGRCTGCATYGPLDPLARGKTLEAGPLSFHLWWHEASYNIVFIYYIQCHESSPRCGDSPHIIYYKHTLSWIITL